MRPLFLLAGLLLANAAPAGAAPQACYRTQLVETSGAYVHLTSGLIYETYPGRDRVAASVWLPLDDIQVCPLAGVVYRLTDLSHPHPVSIRAINLMQS